MLTQPDAKEAIRTPQPLTDGINPFIDDWIATIQNILTANADHYPTPASRITYVDGLVRLPAKQYVLLNYVSIVGM